MVTTERIKQTLADEKIAAWEIIYIAANASRLVAISVISGNENILINSAA